MMEPPARPVVSPGRRRVEPTLGIGWALLLGSATASAVAGAIATKLFHAIDPMLVVGFGCFTAGSLLVAVRRPRTADWQARRRGEVAALGVLIVVNAVFLYVAIEHLPLGTAMTIEFVGPLGLAVSQGRSPREFVAAGAAGCGVVLVCGPSVSAAPLGIVAALLAGGCWAFYIVLNRKVGSYERPPDSLAVALAVGGVLCVPLAADAVTRISSLDMAILLLSTAVLGRLLPMTFEIFALQMMRPGAAGILFAGVPVLGALTGFVVLGQGLSAVQLLGLLMVVSAGVVTLGADRPAVTGRA